MRGFKKFVVCLALLLAGVMLPKPGLARFDFPNNPIPEVFGVELGGDVRDYPGMTPTDSFDDYDMSYSRASDEDITFMDIPVSDVGYTIYEGRISRIFFFVEPGRLTELMAYFRTTYGELTKQVNGHYYWADSYYYIDIQWMQSEGKYGVLFRYCPVLEKQESKNLGINGLEYNNIYLNDPIAKYKNKVMLPRLILEPDMEFVPGWVDYWCIAEDRALVKSDSTVFYQTILGDVYQIIIPFKTERYDEIAAVFQEKYKQWEGELIRNNTFYYWPLGEYEIIIYRQCEDDPQNGEVILRYMPLWRRAIDVAQEHERLNE